MLFNKVSAVLSFFLQPVDCYWFLLPQVMNSTFWICYITIMKIYIIHTFVSCGR